MTLLVHLAEALAVIAPLAVFLFVLRLNLNAALRPSRRGW